MARPDRAVATERVTAMRARQARVERRRVLLIWGAGSLVVLLAAGIVGFSLWNGRTRAAAGSSGTPGQVDVVSTYDVSQGHVTGTVTYAQKPPAGGQHNATWLNCGVYDRQVPNENAVHALEHGAVWVTYDPSLPSEQVEKLRKKIPSTYMLLSPYNGLPSPVVASAWGKQVLLTGVDDPKLPDFITAYRQGPQTPEPGAACTGGLDAAGRIS